MAHKSHLMYLIRSLNWCRCWTGITKHIWVPWSWQLSRYRIKQVVVCGSCWNGFQNLIFPQPLWVSEFAFRQGFHIISEANHEANPAWVPNLAKFKSAELGPYCQVTVCLANLNQNACRYDDCDRYIRGVSMIRVATRSGWRSWLSRHNRLVS